MTSVPGGLPVGSYLVFAFVMGITPGPNNIMLASSGANFGIFRTTPQIVGIILGFPLMMFLVGLGLTATFTQAAVLQVAMKWASAAFMLWMAWGLARTSVHEGKALGRPLTLAESAAFQWINPKAWVIAVVSVAAYTTATGQAMLWQIAALATLDALACVVCCIAWAGFGQGMARFLTSPGRQRAFNLTMAALLVLSILPVLFEDVQSGAPTPRPTSAPRQTAPAQSAATMSHAPLTSPSRLEFLEIQARRPAW